MPRRAIILAGGKGTRLAPYTMVFPKPLMPLGETPILEIIVRQLARRGFDEITLAVGYLAQLIESYFGDGERFGAHIRYAREDTPLGTAGPLAAVTDLDEPFLVMNGDILTTLDYGVFLDGHVASGAAASIATFRRTYTVDFGVVETDAGRVVGYSEKPSSMYEVSMGINALSPRVLDRVQPGVRLDMPDLLLQLIGAGELVRSVLFDGRWLDIGRHDDFAAAQDEFVEHSRDFLVAETGLAAKPDLVVTGAAGFLGRAVLHAAAEAGYQVTGVIRACEGLLGAGTAAAVVLDWGDERALLRLLADRKPAAIVHCAGASGRASSAGERDELYEANVGVTTRLLAAVRRQCPRARVVVLSSAAVYGPSPPIPTGEDAPLAPKTEYAASKVKAEEVARSYTDVGGEVVVARPFNIVGAGEPPGSVIAALATQVLGVPRDAQAHVRLRETSSVRDFLDVEDCARALVQLSVAGVSGRAYNVCSGRGVSIGDLVVSAARVWGRRIELELDEPAAPGTVSIGDPAALTALGWRVERSLDDSLAAIAARSPRPAP